jgi:hypothetical protein
MVLVCVVAVGMLYRWPHQPLLFKKNDFFFWKKRFFDWRNWYQIDFKIFISNWLQNFHIKSNFRIKIRRNIKKKIDWSLICWKKILIGEYGGFWSEFDPYTDQNAYQIPIKFSYQIHVKLRSVCLVGRRPRSISKYWALCQTRKTPTLGPPQHVAKIGKNWLILKLFRLFSRFTERIYTVKKVEKFNFIQCSCISKVIM